LFNNLPQGDYSVTVTDANGCTFETLVTVDMITDITDLDKKIMVNVFPNPTKGSINVTIKGVDEIVEMKIISATGNVLLEDKIFMSNVKNLDLRKLAKGLYFLHIRTQFGKVLIKKINKT